MASQSNIISDLSSYTRVPNKILAELTGKTELCIGSALHDAVISNEDVALLNIGIGTLSVELSTMQCKFIPSKTLKAVLKKSIEDGVDPLEFELEQALVDKLVSLCDEVC